MDPSILVAGKSKQNYDLVKRAFARVDVNIVRATTMSLSLFLAQKNLPFLIISDTDLIDGDFNSFLNELQNDEDLKHIPVVFLSQAKILPQDKERLLERGAAKVISALKTEAELLDQIRPFVRARGKERVLLPEETTE
jgi:CheY-like chemotaxis protein